MSGELAVREYRTARRVEAGDYQHRLFFASIRAEIGRFKASTAGGVVYYHARDRQKAYIDGNGRGRGLFKSKKSFTNGDRISIV